MGIKASLSVCMCMYLCVNRITSKMILKLQETCEKTTVLRIIVIFHMHPPRQNSIYHSFCYTSCRVLAAERNGLIGSLRGIDVFTLHRLNSG